MLALGAIGPPAANATPLLIELIRSYPEDDIGWFAAEALGHVADPEDAEVRQQLREAMDASNQHLRRSAAEALAELQERKASNHKQ